MERARTVVFAVLSLAIPVALVLQFTGGGTTPLFVFSAIAVLPLSSWIGSSTEELAVRMGPTYGALFNATFGNLAEMVIAFFAIRAGLTGVVKASFTGSILGNVLFVAGVAMLIGGWNREKQVFNLLSVESQSGQLVLASAALIIPTLFFALSGGGNSNRALIHSVSIGTSIILLITYAAGLYFSFKTHSTLLGAAETETQEPGWSLAKAVLVLLGSSVTMGVVAEGLVGAVHAVGRSWNVSELFLGFIVIAIVGNAAEHWSAVLLASRNRMDTALNIVFQSSIQIALFVTPVLVFLSYPLGHPLDLVFTPFEVIAVFLAVGCLSYLCLNGESNWFEGVQLLALYAMIGVAAFFLPG